MTHPSITDPVATDCSIADPSVDLSMEDCFYGDVLIPAPIDRPFTYFFQKKMTPGMFVHVPWRHKTVVGIVWNQTCTPPKDITLKQGHILPFPSLHPSVLSFMERVSAYNLIPLGWVLRMVLGGVDIFKAFDDTPHKKKRLQGRDISLENVSLYDLSVQQKDCSQTIDHALEHDAYHAFLLEGLTGSGKTEVYFQGIYTALKHHKQVLVLVPEIGLTQAWLNRFKKQFGFLPHVWHTHTTPLQRRDVWKKALLGESMVVVGARSALFLPFANLGFIVVDEEHDASFKQDEQGSYHGRDMAMLRASLNYHPIVLASATPSLEILENVHQKKCTRLYLSERFGGATLPTIHVVDRRIKKGNAHKSSPWLSTLLLQSIEKRLNVGEQSLLFLNRKGYAPVTLCTSCGYRYVCVACSSTLVQHKEKSHAFLQCHYCGFKKRMDPTCPECNDDNSFHACGPGLDRLTEDVSLCFPQARVAVLSSDLSLKKQRDVWDAIYRGDVDIILGTQILAKGHHLPMLTLVGIIDGDSGLYGSDLRGSEKTFQLLHQVSGRSGREDRIGEVLIQTYQPDHPMFKSLQSHDFKGFVEKELDLRLALNLPPYTRLTSILLAGKDEFLVEGTAKKIASYFYQAIAHLTNDQQNAIKILGPAPAFMVRVNHQYRYRLLIKTEKRMKSSSWIDHILNNLKIPSTVRLMVDVDPVDFM